MKKNVPRYFFLLLVFIVSLAFLGLVGEFILSIFWAIVLTILFHNRFKQILAKMPENPSRAAGLTLGYATLILVFPLILVSGAVILQSGEIVEKIQDSDISIEKQVEDFQDAIPIKKKTLKKYGLSKKKIEKKIIDFFEDSITFMANQAIGISQNVIGLVVNFFLSLYIFYFFLKDGDQLIRELLWVIPMKDKKELELMNRFESVTRATVKGSLVVAFIQGLMGGLLFWAVGIKAAFLWGIVMVIASLLPFGSTIIWGPWAIILLAQGEVGRGLILIAVGAGLIGLIDNFLHPRLVGQDAKLPDYLILLSTFGGISWFGISGFVIGPVIAAFFVTCWQMMGREFGSQRNELMVRTKGKG